MIFSIVEVQVLSAAKTRWCSAHRRVFFLRREGDTVSRQGGLVASSTVEQYLKTMFLIERRSGTRCIPMKTLADAMGVTPGTATSMAKHLHRLTAYMGDRASDFVPRTWQQVLWFK